MEELLPEASFWIGVTGRFGWDILLVMQLLPLHKKGRRSAIINPSFNQRCGAEFSLVSSSSHELIFFTNSSLASKPLLNVENTLERVKVRRPHVLTWTNADPEGLFKCGSVRIRIRNTDVDRPVVHSTGTHWLEMEQNGGSS